MLPPSANRCDGAVFQAFSNSVFSRSGDVESKNRGLESVRKKPGVKRLVEKTRASTGRESVRPSSVLSIFDFAILSTNFHSAPHRLNEIGDID